MRERRRTPAGAWVALALAFLLPAPGAARGEDPPPAPPPSLPATAEGLAEALRERIRPLREAGDLDPLLALAEGRRAVLLGEASHGTEEFYAWRARISERLIAEQGFRFIAVEGDWGACMAVDRYVKGLPGAAESAREALSSFTRWPAWLWSNQVVLELVEWLREHNTGLEPGERVGFYGIDLYGLEESLAKAPRHLRELDEGFAAEAERAYACLHRHVNDIASYLQRVARGDSCASEVAGVVEQLRARRSELSAANPEAYFHAKQNALVVKNAERHYREMAARDASSWNARARHFHLTLERLLEHHGEGSRGIVWAHNTHIGDARATPMGAQGMVNIGMLARRSLGRDDVALVGFGTHRGTVVAGAQWGAPHQVMAVPRAGRGSLEGLLLRVSEEPFLLLSDDVRELSALGQPRPHRAIGVTYDPRREQGNFVPTVLPERYDAFLFLPTTGALRELAAEEGS